MKWAGCGQPLNAAHVKWLDDRIGGRIDYRKCPSLGVYRDELIAVVIFHDWNPEAGVICMSAAGDDPRWMSRAVIKAAHSYPFDQLNCQQVIWQVSERNEPMLSIAKRLGYELHFIPRMRGRDEGEYLCLLTDSTWRASKFSK